MMNRSQKQWAAEMAMLQKEKRDYSKEPVYDRRQQYWGRSAPISRQTTKKLSLNVPATSNMKDWKTDDQLQHLLLYWIHTNLGFWLIFQIFAGARFEGIRLQVLCQTVFVRVMVLRRTSWSHSASESLRMTSFQLMPSLPPPPFSWLKTSF